jgi:hypothetical protein
VLSISGDYYEFDIYTETYPNTAGKQVRSLST